MQTQATSSNRTPRISLTADSSGSNFIPDAGNDCDAHEDSAPAEPEPPEPHQQLENSPPLQNSELSIEILIGEAREVEARHQANPAMAQSTIEFLSRSIYAVARMLGIRSGAITINLLSDPEMTQLHLQFCGLNSTTDVLTFDLDESEKNWQCQQFNAMNADQTPHPAPPPNHHQSTPPDLQWITTANLRKRSHLEVDLAICLDEATRQAHQRSHPLQAELLLYAVHGILHCLGHDDHHPKQFETMHRLEDEILNRIGLAAVFRGADKVDQGDEA